MNKLTAVVTTHDDWICNVLISDGRVYAFNTEVWPEWLDVPDDTKWWPLITETAIKEALRCAARDAQPFAAEVEAVTEAELVAAVSRACHYMSDKDFKRLLR